MSVVRRWTDDEWRAFAKFTVASFAISAAGALILVQSLDEQGGPCPTTIHVRPVGWIVVAVVLLVVTWLAHRLQPPWWPLWVGLGLGIDLWLYSIVLTLDAC